MSVAKASGSSEDEVFEADVALFTGSLRSGVALRSPPSAPSAYSGEFS